MDRYLHVLTWSRLESVPACLGPRAPRTAPAHAGVGTPRPPERRSSGGLGSEITRNKALDLIGP